MRDPRTNEDGAAMIIALLLTVLLFTLGAALLALSETETLIAANDEWSEGAFQAAEAAVQVAVDQLDVGAVDGVVAETGLGEKFTFRSGGADDGAPQAPVFVGATPGAGYSVSTSTGYSSGGFQFLIYRINGTGFGPRNTSREVEVEVVLGPVPE